MYQYIIFKEDKKLNKVELVAEIAAKSGVSKKDAEASLNAFMEVVGETLKKGEQIHLVGFGTFKVSESKERVGKNPKTGEAITIKASKKGAFKAGSALKNL